MKRSQAQIIREYGPFPGVDAVHGLTYDGRQVWFATGGKLLALDPDSGATTREIEVAANAGTAFDGTHLYQIADGRIQKIEPGSGRVVSTIPAPGAGEDSGLAWAEGCLWVGEYRQRKIHQVDPADGRVLRTPRIRPLRHGRDVGGRTAVARYLGERRERTAAGRRPHRRRAAKRGDARGHGRIRIGVGWRRPLFLRRRRQRQAQGGAASGSGGRRCARGQDAGGIVRRIARDAPALLAGVGRPTSGSYRAGPPDPTRRFSVPA